MQRLADDFLNAAAPGDNPAMMELGARVRAAGPIACCVRCSGSSGAARLALAAGAARAQKDGARTAWSAGSLIDPRGHTVWRRRPADGLYANLPDLPSLDEGEKAENFGDVVCFEETTQRLSHRLLRPGLAWTCRAFQRAPYAAGEALLADGPPTPVARLVRRLANPEE